ncbi:MAG: 4Fe-4S dicluster domain-containing protein [Nitrospiraceae bacterium]|nr:4Fe-4S dicluster domain-containing protein [Nitrospiraceae bacterium]
MRWDLSNSAVDSVFRSKVERLSDQNLGDCYQCGKCSGGCPVVPNTQSSPSRVMRMVQLGMEEDAMVDDLVWSCAGCGTCTGRCPEGVDTARVIDAVRAVADARDVSLPQQCAAVRTFYKAFLGSVRDFGRLSEVGLMGGYNINSGRFWTNVAKAPWFLLKGKVGLSAHRVRQLDRLARVFERVENIERAILEDIDRSRSEEEA